MVKGVRLKEQRIPHGALKMQRVPASTEKIGENHSKQGMQTGREDVACGGGLQKKQGVSRKKRSAAGKTAFRAAVGA
ncbi:MAG: hypothetical protein R6V60_19700 [Desulfobacterales bacterium]